jgi:hypothetical protein
MWDEGLRSMMMFMTSLLSQPFSAAQSNAIVRAGLMRRMRSRFVAK